MGEVYLAECVAKAVESTALQTLARGSGRKRVLALHPLLITPQQPVKVVALVGASPTRRVGLFATEHELNSVAARRG